MRLASDDRPDGRAAFETIAAAVDAGVTVFDTAHAYAFGVGELGDNEALLARALRQLQAHTTARVVTKGGMRRTAGRWIPDGRARAIVGDCESSLAALDGLAIDLYLLHAPDPQTPWQTSLRALGRLLTEGMVMRVGVSNVNRAQLDEALETVDIAAVENALSVYDDSALRGGVIERCSETGIAFIAHSPLGGTRRASSLARQPLLTEIAAAHDATAAEIALAWLLELSPAMVAIPGARRPDTARSCARAATLALTGGERTSLSEAFGSVRPRRVTPPRAPDGAGVVMVMGIPGAGKTRVAETYVARGYHRLNRDARGGSLRDIAAALESEMDSGIERIVLDNTYLTRASRSHVIETAQRHGVAVDCIWCDTPLAQAQVNLVERLLERFGSLPGPEELRVLAKREPGILTPTSQMRTVRELEPPTPHEGFAALEHLPFSRMPASVSLLGGSFIVADALTRPGWDAARVQIDASGPHLVFDWNPDGNSDTLIAAVERLSSAVSGSVAGALCPHPAGPPICWCRPPLPGLPLAFARAQGVDPARSTLVGTGPAHRTLAAALACRYVSA
jgi:aryl-alcohol dehydrogenase-like predicted oxidoreductase